jgi:hypothetical protein
MMNVLDCLFLTTQRTFFSLVESGYNTLIGKHVLTSIVAPVLGYGISAPQDTMDIKMTGFSSFRIFSWGISSQHNLPPWNTGTYLDHLLHYDTT